ncbi:DUF2288 domain-containing protein [Noviherbaspirillum saxi]|uniref:DUF2288 domain-containing protein n=1 Tax=Noviherbaspirillum saxi TaxID=2320863 RepID=A0A3A3FPP7_9BURK|nr:DUF2288 domain-containing protein [Noviherbaspirillum saxi]RJF97174.1 DUF2288 domain-containing protein [Noviherbaspirillum saxi]
MTETNNDLLRAKINGETARMQWMELQRFFASGAMIAVSEQLDLVDVAVRIAADDKQAVQQWMADGLIGKVTDAQAQSWLESNAELWAVVIKPWILVQREKMH